MSQSAIPTPAKSPTVSSWYQPGGNFCGLPTGFLATDWFRNVFTALAVFVAFLGIIASWFSQEDNSKQQDKLQREITANQSWEGISEIAMANPQLANGGIRYLTGKSDLEIAYRWYMERFLITGEQILRARPRDAQWTITLLTETEVHRDYIDQPWFRGNLPTDTQNTQDVIEINSTYCSYLKEFRGVLKIVILDYQREKFPKRMHEVNQAMFANDSACPGDDDLFSNGKVIPNA